MSRRLRSALAAQGPPPTVPSRPPLLGAIRPMPGDLRPDGLMPGPLILDLVAALVQGGAPPGSALRSVAAALASADDPRAADLLGAAARVGDPMSGTTIALDAGAQSERLTAVLEESLWLAARSGLPPTALIRRSAAEERRRRAAAQLRAVRRLEVLLVVPAGLCLLPAFVLLGVVPVALDLILG